MDLHMLTLSGTISRVQHAKHQMRTSGSCASLTAWPQLQHTWARLSTEAPAATARLLISRQIATHQGPRPRSWPCRRVPAGCWLHSSSGQVTRPGMDGPISSLRSKHHHLT